jgi:hypothetical protein
VWQFTAHGSRSSKHDDINTQDATIIMMQETGYRPILPSHQTVVPNSYSWEGMAQMGYMGHTPTYDDVDVERLYSHNEADADDSETQTLNGLHGGIGATHGE